MVSDVYLHVVYLSQLYRRRQQHTPLTVIMVKLHKKQPAMHSTLQNAVVAAINDPNYSFSLPQLADWDSVVSSSVDEKQRLEFVGDAIMHLSVSLYLYRLFPNAAPGFYTVSYDPGAWCYPFHSYSEHPLCGEHQCNVHSPHGQSWCL